MGWRMAYEIIKIKLLKQNKCNVQCNINIVICHGIMYLSLNVY